MRILTLPACLLLMATPPLHSQAAPTAQPPALHWGPAPGVFPTGAMMAVISGDPGKAAPFTIELAMPAGYKIPPHFHPTAETVTVKRGTLLVGMGDAFDASKTKPMQVGDSGSIPANAHHFAAVKVATFITVSAMGPFAMTYVHPADDPQKAAAKP
jgi:quercetin dioxygenase-like cupin family protein